MDVDLDGDVHPGLPWRSSLQCENALHHRRQHLVARHVLCARLSLDSRRPFRHPARNDSRHGLTMVLSPPNCPGTYIPSSHQRGLLPRDNNPLRHNLPFHPPRFTDPPSIPNPPSPRPSPSRHMLLHRHAFFNSHTHQSPNPHLQRYPLPTAHHFFPRLSSLIIHLPQRSRLHPLPLPQHPIPDTTTLLHPFPASPPRHSLHHLPRARFRRLGQHRPLTYPFKRRRRNGRLIIH